jgi:hypothetical protein
MNRSDPRVILGKLHGLRTELVELAFVLDRRGRIEAADVAMTISGRVGELCEELAAGQRESGTKLPEDETAA